MQGRLQCLQCTAPPPRVEFRSLCKKVNSATRDFVSPQRAGWTGGGFPATVVIVAHSRFYPIQLSSVEGKARVEVFLLTS